MANRRSGRIPALKVTAISSEDLAILLSKSAGKSVSRDTIRDHVVAGAPVNEDGTLNLVHYTAWLVKELSGHGD